MQFEYEDGLQPGGRRPRLWLVKGAEAVKFAGKSIPGFCLIAKEIYKPNGKWSYTKYTLHLAPGVRPLHFLSPLHGIWGQSLDSWDDVVKHLNLPLDVCRSIVEAEYPATAKRLDEIEAFANEHASDIEVVDCFVSTPSRRRNTPDYWAEEKDYRSQSSKKVVIKSKDGTYDGWKEPVILQPDGAKILAVKEIAGDTWHITVLVPIA